MPFSSLSLTQKYNIITVIDFKTLNFKAYTQLFQILCNGIDVLNSSFTFHLAPIIVSMLVFNVFSVYGVLWEFLNDSKIKLFTLLLNGTWLTMQYTLQAMLAYAGSSVTKKGRETAAIVSKVLNDFELSNELASKLQNFLTRSQCRNMKVQNCFFVIDWKILVSVS